MIEYDNALRDYPERSPDAFERIAKSIEKESAMTRENPVTIQLSAEDAARIGDALATVQEILKPYLTSLSASDREAIPKTSEKTEPFVRKVLEYMQTHPQFVPNYLSTADMKLAVDTFDLFDGIARPLKELSAALADTVMLSGSRAYTTALSYYNSVKQAVKMNAAGAKVVFDDLRVKFEGYGPKPVKKPGN